MSAPPPQSPPPQQQQQQHPQGAHSSWTAACVRTALLSPPQHDVRPDEWLTHDVALLPDTRKPAAGDAGGERRAVRVTDVLKV